MQKAPLNALGHETKTHTAHSQDGRRAPGSPAQLPAYCADMDSESAWADVFVGSPGTLGKVLVGVNAIRA